MCMTEEGKVLSIDGKKAIVDVKGEKKEVTHDSSLKAGDIVQVFQNTAFK